MLNRLMGLYLVISIFSSYIYITTEFVLSDVYQYILFGIEASILLVISIYLIKNIKYSFNSFSSYCGLLGLNLIIFILFHFGLIYPLSYILHESTKENKKEQMNIVSKLDNVSSTAYMKKYRYKIYLKNENFSKMIYLNEKQISKKDYDKLRINSIMTIELEKSFFGYTLNSFNI